MLSSHIILVLLITSGLAAIVFAAAKPKPIPSRALFLFRAFFPSWKFFEDCDYIPELYRRTCPANSEQWGPWQRCLTKPKRQVGSLLLNPHGNLLLMCQSLLQQLVSDLDEVQEVHAANFETVTSYQLTKNLVAFQLRREGETLRFQFKVCARFPSSPERAPERFMEDMLISPIYEV